MKAGDHIVSSRGIYIHHGLYIGEQKVIHYSGLSEKFNKGCIEVTSLQEFEKGNGSTIKKHTSPAYDAKKRVERAFQRLGEDDYSVTFNNCEHFVNWCFYGNPVSSQVNMVKGAGVAMIQPELVSKTVEQLAKKVTKEITESTTKSGVSSVAKGAPYLTIGLACLDFGVLIKKYAKGQIDGIEFMEQAGEKGTNLSASAIMSAIGQAAIPIPVVGALIGGMIGYTLSSIYYTEALAAFKGAKEARQEHYRIKAQYEEAKRQRDLYQAELQRQFDLHMSEVKNDFLKSFQCIDSAVETGDMDSFAYHINNVGKLFNAKLQFDNRREFDSFMNSDKILIL